MPPSLFAVAVPVVLFLVLWALCALPLAGVVSVGRASAKGASAWIVGSRVGKWSLGHAGPMGSYAPIALVMLAGGIAALVSGYLFVELAEQVRLTTSVVSRADQAIHTWFGQERQAPMTVLFSTATAIGGTPGMAVIVTAVAATLLLRKERESAVFVVITAVMSEFLNLGLKLIFARARPDLTAAIAVARGYSFPSGHAMGSFVGCGAVAYIVLRQAWSWGAKSAALALALTIVVLVGVSRVYLGVHWASDIAGGWSAGAVWLTSAVVAFETLLRIGARRRGPGPASPAAGASDESAPARRVVT